MILSRSRSYCEHCLNSRKKANEKYNASHRSKNYQRTLIWRDKNPDKVSEHVRLWYQKHKDKYKEYNKAYKKTAKYKDKQKEYSLSHKEFINLRSRNWQAANKSRSMSNKKRWMSENPSKSLEYVHKRRSREINAVGIFTSYQWEQLQSIYGNRCLWCGVSNVKLSPDHVVPLSRGGTNYIENIQPLCRSCNSKKSAKILDFRPFGNFIMDWT